ncbi:hypothetical protein KV097_16570 [Mumia sp. zg.B17]|uniref:hypothetical protein n=1 Tax=Mumia sp. zg.B17 TaxID=2855446 RepID=UPI001C6E2E51|nr:hypothetical protein [Mumia sp. zg.B17]MBW9207553.1 hypothetical protein [Mumia sp. zg.B17]
MTKQTTDDMDTALRSLDAAPETSLSDAERQHADDTFTRIVTSPTAVPPAKEPTWLRRRWRRLLPIGALAAAGTAAAALALGGGSAFASWTSKPEPLTATESAAAADTCRAKLAFNAKRSGRPRPAMATTSANQNVLAERRGGWTYVFITAPSGEATCLMRNAAAGEDPADHKIYANIEESTPTPPLHPRQLDETGNSDVVTDEGWFRKGYLVWIYGYVGKDVKAVTVRTPIGTDVEATVENGRFAAWWPSEAPSSKHPEVMGAWHYTVTLSDGSTLPATGGLMDE